MRYSAMYFGIIVHVIIMMDHCTLIEKYGELVIVDTADLKLVRAARACGFGA